MTQGFKPMLDNCSMKYGAVDEPSGGSVNVFTGVDDPRDFDAVGIDEYGGETVLMGFDWIEPDDETIENIAEEVDEDIESIREEFNGDIMILRSVVPFDEVTWTEVDTGGLL